MTTPRSTFPRRSAAKNGNGRTFLERVANLSTVLTLVALVAIGAGAQKKLDAIGARAKENCRAINGGILLTLEASRNSRSRSRSQERALNRTIARFQDLENRC